MEQLDEIRKGLGAPRLGASKLRWSIFPWHMWLVSLGEAWDLVR
jgi:hypothetical protein